MAKGSSGGGESSTTKPWSSQARGAYTNIYGQADQLADNQLAYGPSTVTPYSATTNQAISGLGNYGLSTNTPVQTAQSTLDQVMAGSAAGPGRTELANTAQGGFLGANPYIDAQYDRAADQVTDAYRMGTVPAIDSRFAQGGRVGSGYHARAMQQGQEDFGETLAGMASNMYGQDYARERGFMNSAQMGLSGFEADDTRQRLAAAGLTPALNQAQMSQYGGALTAGGLQDDMSQRLADEQAARFQFEQMEPYQRLGLVNNLLTGGNSGFGTVTASGSGGNQAAGIAGGVLAGAGSGAMIGTSVPGIGPGWGTAGGALLGGLAGAFG